MWPTFGNHDVIPASRTPSTHDADHKRNNFRRAIHPESVIAVAFVFAELDRGLHPGPEDRKKALSGLDRGRTRKTRKILQRKGRHFYCSKSDTLALSWRPFLESPENISGLRSHFQLSEF